MYNNKPREVSYILPTFQSASESGVFNFFFLIWDHNFSIETKHLSNTYKTDFLQISLWNPRKINKFLKKWEWVHIKWSDKSQITAFTSTEGLIWLVGKDLKNNISKATKENKPVLPQLPLWNRADKLVHTMLLWWITLSQIIFLRNMHFNK